MRDVAESGEVIEVSRDMEVCQLLKCTPRSRGKCMTDAEVDGARKVL